MPQVKGSIVKASPYTACGLIGNAVELKGHIALALRGDCMFAAKARWLQEAGAIGVIFIGEDHLYSNRSIFPYSTSQISICTVYNNNGILQKLELTKLK